MSHGDTNSYKSLYANFVLSHTHRLLCHCYILDGIICFASFNYKYEHNVITNVLHLNKHFFLSFFTLAFVSRFNIVPLSITKKEKK